MRNFVLGAVATLVALAGGLRMTGMPAWTGVVSDDQIWKVIAFVKNSGTLPPEVQAAWQQAAYQFK
jgi:mono/diheme cytochrome c family protein